MIRWFVGLLAVLAALLGLLVALVRRDDLPQRQLVARYSNAASVFLPIGEGLSIHVRDEGPSTGLPVILLHGASSSLQTWEPWVHRLGRRYRLISLDLPGHGLTGPHPRGDYSIGESVRVVQQVARAKGLGRFVIAGNSLGGEIAWHYALAHPQQIRGLILIDAAGITAPKAPQPQVPLGFRLAHLPLSGLFIKMTPDWLVERSIRQTVSVQASVTGAVVRRYADLLRYPGNREAMLQRMQLPSEPDQTNRLSSIFAPTLVLWGRLDRLIPVENGIFMAKRIPNARFVAYEGVGHLPQEEVPDESAADAGAFLNRLISRQAASVSASQAAEQSDQLDMVGPDKLPNWP